MADNKGVLVFGEVADGNLASITLEALGIGRKLANDLGEELAAIILGSGIAQLGDEAVAYGADKVYVVDDPLLNDYLAEPYIEVMAKVCKDLAPNVLILGGSSLGRDLAPRLAFRLDTGLCTDCIQLAIDPATKLLVQTRTVYGAIAVAEFVCDSARPQMTTVKSKAMEPAARDASRKGEVISVAAGLDASKIKTKLIERTQVEVTGVKLEDAEIVVGAGRGIGEAENFQFIEEMARILGGAPGASRPLCEQEWVPAGYQIGLTGKTISPQLYIAIGISGSAQHMAGCGGSKNIVAINRDPEANIFKSSRWGIVADWKQVLPPLIEELKKLVSS